MDQIIRDVIEIPDRKPSLVIKVGEIGMEERRREYVESYVITELIAKELESLVKSIAESAETGFQGIGVWVDGPYGSGKSHFLSFLGLLLQCDEMAWRRLNLSSLDPYLDSLKRYPVFVVPVNALDDPDSFRRNFYRAVERQLERRSLPPVELSSTRKLISEFERQAEAQPLRWDLLFENSLTVTDRENFERMKEENPDELAGEIRRHVYGDAAVGVMDFYEPMTEGMRKLTEHLRDQGFKALVVLLDEITLLLRGRERDFQGRTLADINRMLEHENAALPVWALVSRHIELEDIVGQDAIAHLRDRFQKRIEMQAVDLYEVCFRRVLRRRDGGEVIQEALERNWENLPQEQRRTLAELYGGEGELRSALEKLYPFHPTILDTLVAVTHRLSRERTAISVMYDMLFEVADEPIGTWLPYARAFDVLFSGGATSVQGENQLLAAWQLVVEKVEPRLEELFPDDDEIREKAKIVLRTLVLGQLTDRPRRICDRMTPQVIAALNAAELNRGIPFLAQRELMGILDVFSERIPQIQRSGDGRYNVELTIGPDPDEALDRLEVQSLHEEERRVALSVLSDLFPVQSSDGKKIGYQVTWRGTQRRGIIQVQDLSTLSANSLHISSGQEYLILIGLPSGGEIPSLNLPKSRDLIALWKPEPLSPEKVERWRRLAKLNWALENPAARAQLEQRYNKRDVEQLRQSWMRQREIIRERLRDDWREAYLNGKVESCLSLSGDVIGSSTGDALRDLIRRLFDRRFGQHPEFTVDLSPKSLDRLYRLTVRNPKSVDPMDKDHYISASGIGKPLGIYRIQGNFLTFDLRNSLYVKFLEDELLNRGGQASVKALRDKLYDEFGLQRIVADLLLKLLVAFRDYRLMRGKEPLVIAKIADIELRDNDILSRAALVQTPVWIQFNEICGKVGLPSVEVEHRIHVQDSRWGEFTGRIKRIKSEVDRLNQSLEGRLSSLGIPVSETSVKGMDEWRDYLRDIEPLMKLDSAEGINEVVRLDLPEVGLEDVKREVSELLETLGDSKLNKAVNEASDRGKVLEILRALVRGEFDLDQAIERISELKADYEEGGKERRIEKVVSFRIPKGELLEKLSGYIEPKELRDFPDEVLVEVKRI
jgi:hypothetical protein